MKNIKLIPFLGLVSLVPTLAEAKPKPKAKPERPNILFILSDDHSRQAISAYGGRNAELAPTPNIDRIANEGALFNNMLVTNSISGPSRASLVTGKYSTTNGFYQNEGGIVFNNEQVQYQMLLQDAGYQTALFGKWHLYSTPKGFDYYMIHANPGQQGTYFDPIYETNGKKAKHEGYCTHITTDATLEWLSERDEDKPFCVMLHYKAPHRPWEAEPKYENLWEHTDFPYPDSFNDDYSTREQTLGQSMATIENHISRGDVGMPVPPGIYGKQATEWLWYGGSGEGQKWTPDQTMSDEEVKNWKYQLYLKKYLRTIKSVDDGVGRVLDYLEEEGISDNTIIIYMGDQGFYLGEHGLYDKRWMYEESLQMPCLVRYPSKIEAGSQVNQLALNIDIAPTLLDYVGIDIPKDIQGESMVGLFEHNKKVEKKWRKAAYYQYFEYPKWHNVQPHYGVRTDRYKLIHYYYNIDTWEFFDLEKDPNEYTNQYNNEEYASIIKDLKKELTELQNKYDDNLPLDERRELTDRYMLKYNNSAPSEK